MKLTETMLRKMIQEELSASKQFNRGQEVNVRTRIPDRKRGSIPGMLRLIITSSDINGTLTGVLPKYFGTDDEDEELIAFSIDDIVRI